MWVRVQELIGRVEDEVRVETGRQKARVEQHIRGEVDAAVDQIAEGLTKPIRDVREAADDLVRSATDQVTSDVKHRIEGIKSRLLGEVSARLRGETSTIGLGSRLRARRDISRLAKTGVLRAEADPIRQSLRGLAAAGAERVVAVAVVTSALTAAAAVAAIGDGDIPPSTTVPATSSSTAETTTTAALRIEVDDPPNPVNAGSDLELTWASGDAVLDLVVVSWETSDGRTWTTAYDEGAPAATVPIPLDAPPSLTVRVTGASGDGRAEDVIELHVNQPPSLTGRSIVTTEGSGPQREDLGARIDDDLTSMAIEGAKGTFEVAGNRWLLFDSDVLGPGAFGACVVATDEGDLASPAWVEVEVLPAIGRGDSLWAISRRLLVAEGSPDPSAAEINDRMLALRLQRWLTDPELIFSEDVVSQLIELEPVEPMGPCQGR